MVAVPYGRIFLASDWKQPCIVCLGFQVPVINHAACPGAGLGEGRLKGAVR